MNYSRAELKLAAKSSLSGRYGQAIGVMLLYGVITYALMIPYMIGYLKVVFTSFSESVTDSTTAFHFDSASIVLILISLLLVLIVLPFLTLGYTNFFIKLSRNQNASVGDLFSRAKYFLKSIGLTLLIAIKVLLWSCLFYIPGVIAAYRYSMAFYIMAENPDVGVFEAIRQSKVMMKGNKGKLFILELSFIGWSILASFTCGILYFWLLPYMMTTYANFYNKMLEIKPE